MKRLIALVAASQLLLAWSCSAVSTSFDYDTEADFARLQTYAWVPVEHDETISELVFARVENAVHEVLKARGYLAVPDNPDFSIHAHISRGVRTQINETGERFDDRGWSGHHLEVHTYDEGTLVLDVEESSADALVWRGVARRAINDQWTPEQITERVREAVELLLAEFPPKT